VGQVSVPRPWNIHRFRVLPMPADNPEPKPRSRQWQGLSFPLQILLGFLFVCALVFIGPELVKRLEKPWRIIFMLLPLVPLVAATFDIAQGTMRPSARNLLVGFLLYTFRLVFLLGVQLAVIPIAFLLGPVWLFAIFFTVADIVVRLPPGAEQLSVPTLCYWAKIGHPYCVPALIVYHLVSVVLAFLALRYGERLLDASAVWYQRATEWLAQQVQA
jgi:hypothetical protein